MAFAIVIEEGFTLLEGLWIILFQPHQTFQIPQFPLETLPGGLLGAEHCDSEGAHRDMGGPEAEELSFDEGQIKQVTSIKEDLRFVDIDGTTVVLEKCLRWRTIYVKFDSRENLGLHLEDLRRVKEVVRELDEVFHDGWVNLLELAGDPERRDAQQLKLAQPDVFFTQVPVNDVNSDKERFGAHLAFHLKTDQPIYESLSVLGPDVRLSAHIVGTRLVLALSKFQR